MYMDVTSLLCVCFLKVNLKEVLSSLGDVLTRPPLFSEEERWFGATCEKCGDMLKSVSSCDSAYLCARVVLCCLEHFLWFFFR